MSNTWIVVPVTKNDVDLTEFVNKLSGGYVAPENYEVFVNASNTVTNPHPYAGQNSPNFSNKIIFVNMVDGYTEYDGVVHLESFGEINIPRLMNVGINYAIANGADYIAVLSNPCNFDPFIILDAINNNYQKEIINIADGVFFILSKSTNLRLNENLRVWYWSEDLYRTANNETTGECKLNYLCLSELIPLYVDTPDLVNITKEDESQYNTKWI